MEKYWYLDNFIYCEFIITFKCNYRCPYCYFSGRQQDAYMFREKGPWVPINKSNNIFPAVLRSLQLLKYADAFKNYPLARWQELFATIFKGKIAYVSFTGGEPLLHNNEINELIKTVADVSDQFMIRFDTNGSIIPHFPKEFIDHISFVVSYHKSQVPLDKLLSNLENISKQGKIQIINRVLHSEDELPEALKEIDLFAAQGFFMNITPAFFDVNTWKKENIEILKKVTSPLDYQLRVERKTKGLTCKWPLIGFQLLPTGYAHVFPCLTDTVNLIKTKDIRKVLSKTKVVCPSTNCTCLHAYSFLDCTDRNAHSYDVLENFVRENAAHRIENK
jgi:organic radical activating enzyme